MRVPDDVAELVRNLHPHLKKKIKLSLRQIMSDPSSGKELKDDLRGLRSFRVSRFRIIYRVSPANQIEYDEYCCRRKELSRSRPEPG